MKDLSIVVPAYNERDNLPRIIKRFEDIVRKYEQIDMELIIVENGSADGSNDYLMDIGNENIGVVHLKENRGYGGGIMAGLKKAKGEYLCWTHADLQTDLKDAIRAYRLANGKSDVFVKGRRKRRSLSESIFTGGMTIFESILFMMPLTDINAQPNLFHKSMLELCHNPPKDFSFDLFMYVMSKKNKLRIHRFPVRFWRREHGESKWNTGISSKVKFIKRTIRYSFRLRRDMTCR